MQADKICNVEEEVVTLITDIANMKTSLVDVLINRHSQFADRNEVVQDLALQLDEVHDRYVSITADSDKTCEALYISTEEREKYMSQIDSLQQLRSTVVNLLEIDKRIHVLSGFIDPDFEISPKCLRAISQEVEAVKAAVTRASPSLCVQDKKVYQTIVGNLNGIKNELVKRVEAIWNSKVVFEHWDKNPYFDYNFSNKNDGFVPICKSVTLNLDSALLRELIVLMHAMHIGSPHLKSLVAFIAENLIYPAVEDFRNFSILTEIENDKVVLGSYNKRPDESVELLHSANSFLDSMTDAFQFVHDRILSVDSDSDPSDMESLLRSMNYELYDSTLTTALVKYFLPKIFIIHEVITKRLYEFEKFLVTNNYIRSNNNALRTYIEHFHLHAKTFEENNFLSAARELFLGSLLKYGAKLGDTLRTPENVDTTCAQSRLSRYVDLNSSIFPKCNVSFMAAETFSIIKEYITYYKDDKLENLEDLMIFIDVIPDMIMLYLAVVPVSNKKELEDIPQAAALHYNNCMYIAHRCMNLSRFIRKMTYLRLTTASSSNKVARVNAPDYTLKYVYQMRDVALKTITREWEKQRANLDEFFDEIVTFAGVGGTDTKERDMIERTLNKCAIQVHMLDSAYCVLPDRVYDGFFGGMLVEHVLSRLVAKVLAMPDIVQKDTKPLEEVVRAFSNKVADVFERRCASRDLEEPTFVPGQFMGLHVPAWHRVELLLLLLGSSLLEIERLHDSGKGPLVSRFSPAELRALVKALFRNSSLRSKVLDKLQ